MKLFKTIALCVLTMVCILQTSAQAPRLLVNEPDYNKPRLFNDLPERVAVDTQILDNLLALPEGSSVIIPLGKNFKYLGTVVSKSDPQDASVSSTVIRCSNRLGAAFTLSKIINPDQSFTYIGNIMSMKHGDSFELVADSGQYYLTKKQLFDLYNE